MKVALVVPEPSVRSSMPGSDCAPFGLGYLASYLRKYVAVNVKIIDGQVKNNIEDEIVCFKPDLVGVTATSPQIPDAYRLLDSLRSKGIYTVAGGIHASVLPQEAAEHADSVIVGEGEVALLKLVKQLELGNRVKGIIQGEYIEDLNDLPSPAFDLIDFKPYLNRVLSPNLSLPCVGLITSRGCPYKCNFCYNSSRRTKARYFSAQRVMEDMTYFVEKYHVQSVFFYDDEFAVNKKRLFELARLFEETGLNRKITWGCLARVNSLDNNTLKLMRKMNCVVIRSGFESAVPRLIKYLKNGTTTVEQNARPLPLAHQAGIVMGGSFIFGTPTETLEEMKRTFKWITEQDTLKFMDYNTMIPYPGTPVWKWAKAKGCLPNKIDYAKYSAKCFSDSDYLVDKTVSVKNYVRFFNDITFATWVITQFRRFPHFKTLLRLIRTDTFWRVSISHPFLVLGLMKKLANKTLTDLPMGSVEK
jgi:radical SAM superfamily enzyme YgiQ (UPF0313 family)